MPETTESVHWACLSCGAFGEVQCGQRTSFRRVVQDVENEHAAKSSECPWDRDRISLSVLV